MFYARFAVCSIILTALAPACAVIAHDEIGSPMPHNDEPVVYGVVRRDIGQQWVYVDPHLALGDRVHVKQELRNEDELHVVVDNMGRGIGEQVRIELKRTGAHQFSANSSVTWHHDYGSPFEGSWTDVRGAVWVNVEDLSSAKLIVHFELRGMVDGKQQFIHGEVPLSN